MSTQITESNDNSLQLLSPLAPGVSPADESSSAAGEAPDAAPSVVPSGEPGVKKKKKMTFWDEVEVVMEDYQHKGDRRQDQEG